MTDEDLSAMRRANTFARTQKSLSPRQQQGLALSHFVTDGNPYTRTGAGLQQFLSEQGEQATPQGMYAAAVSQSLDRPVISLAAASRQLGGQLDPEKYPQGYLTPREYLAEKASLPGRQFIAAFEAQTKRAAPQNIVAMADAITQRALEQVDDVAGALAGTLETNRPGVRSTVAELRSLVAAHTPNGPLASPADVSESEYGQWQQQYGSDAKYMLNQAGRQNHEAQRVAELWSARDENYAPDSTLAQAQRFIGGMVAPIYKATQGTAKVDDFLFRPEWDEMALISQPNGKLQYAANVYDRGKGDEDKQGPVSVYTPEGYSKYGPYDLSSNPAGLANATDQSQSYPMGWFRQNVGYPVMEAGTALGNYLAGGDSNTVSNLRALRQAYNRITPVRPDAVDSETFNRLGQQAKQSTNELTGFNSAVLGPKLSDAYNATLGKVMGESERSYLSPAMQTLIEAPAEMMTDPVNLAFNSVIPMGSAVMGAASGAMRGGITGAARQGGENLIRSLSKAPARMADDIFEETATEGPAVQSAVSSLGDYFSPEADNFLMGTERPDSPGFDERVAERSTDARQRQMDAANEYGQRMGIKPSPYTAPTKPWMPTMLLSR